MLSIVKRYKQSPLAQGRGLKLPCVRRVGLCAGSPLAQGRGLKRLFNYHRHLGLESPLAQGRGLKLVIGITKSRSIQVAPRTGAWIETIASIDAWDGLWSPLAQGRGLKPSTGPLCADVVGRPSHRGVD